MARRSRWSVWLKVLALAAMVAVVIIGLRQLAIQDYLQNALVWVQDLGPVGAIAFMGLYIVATVFFIPGSVLTLGGGAVFGVGLGSLYVFVAACIGATLAFLVGRYVARGWVAQKVAGKPRFQAVESAIARDGLKVVILTRLSPVFPFNLLNYALGLTPVSLKDYLLGFVGMIPGTIAYVYIGSVIGLAAIGTAQPPESQTTVIINWTIRIVGLIATLAVTFYVTRLARKALNESLEVEDLQAEEMES